MSSVTELIIGIDLGSTSITGVLGRRITGGIELIALEKIPVISGIRRGVIHNIEEVSRGIQELLDKLTDKSVQKCKVNQIYIGINGYSIRTVDVTCTTNLSGDEIFNENHLDDLSDEVESKVPENLSIIDIFPQEFVVDGKIDVNPVGSMPSIVEAHYKVVAGKPVIFRNIDACMDRLHIRYEQILGPLASAESVLVSDEKAKGVVVVDFGAETTSVCIYKGNMVRYISILPFGGANITTDLLQLNIDDEEAERLKLENGTALHYSEISNIEEKNPEMAAKTDFEKETNEIIVARAEEIVENIYAQIRFSGAELQKLTAGIVITGGASRLPGLDTLISRKTGMSIREGNPMQNIASKPEGLEVQPRDALGIGLLLLGKTGCCTEAEPVVKPQEKPAEKPDSAMTQTLGGFEDKDDKKKNKNKLKKEKPKTGEKTGGRFSGLFKGLFDDEDL